MGQTQKQGEDRMSHKNNKGANKKMESNDSPEIPDRGGDMRRARPPFGRRRREERLKQLMRHKTDLRHQI